jgi:glycosyltransferase involved in cell wall biosynthesis
MKLRTLLLSTSLGLGGADRQILYLAEALLAHDYEVLLVSMTPVEEMGREAVAEGLPIMSLGMKRGQADWRAFRQLVTLLRGWQPHLLTTFMYHANLLGRLAGRWAGVPLIVTSIRSERTGSAARDWLFRITNWMDQCCTTNSEEVATSLWNRRLLPREKLTVIPNGVDIAGLLASADQRARLRDELGLAPAEFVWLAVGRLLEQKDYPTLLHAFQLSSGSPSRLLIAGRGPLLDDLQRLAGRLGIAAAVTFLGVREDIPSLLAAADGFVLSSAWEGMPNVVMEALAAARPVVATRVGGVAELVEPGRSGLLVPPRDPGALSRAMRQMMSLSLEQRGEMGRHGRRHVTAHYTLARMADRWMALYQELLKQPPVRWRAPA